MDRKVAIRELIEQDCAVISHAFTAQGWNKPSEQYVRYFQESLNGTRVVLLAEIDEQFAGYVTIVWESDYPPFCQAGIPEIVDFNVLKKYRRMKIGTALLDEAERRIAERSAFAGLGVCLDPDFGPAQVLYARRGYIPDGRGVYWNGVYPQHGDQVVLDYDLGLYLLRQVR
jgi:GNAT superfamily N-acetyltransferase